METHVVIMAGGIGSRLWPVSTPERPKQFMDLLGIGKTMIQLTFNRFTPVCDPANFWVVTSEDYVGIVREQLPLVPQSHILAEPEPRNTAPCIAYACWKIQQKHPNANIVVSPADHIVMNSNEFRRVITSALKFTSETDSIVTLGMKPTRPETGYGYIQADLRTPSARNKEIYRVDQFREKPDLATATEYIKDKSFFWNAGIFVMSAATIVNAFRVYQPSIAKIFESMRSIYGTEKEQAEIDLRYPECESISIDYAIMEKAEEIFVMPADFGWSDLGTWGSLLVQSHKDLYGNATIGENIVMIESKNNIVHTLNEKKVVIQGLEGYIVAEEDGILLICKLSEEQRIKQFSGSEK